MNTSNWPQGIDYSSTNWTGRVHRTDNWGGNWQANSQHIPVRAWIGAAAVVAVLFFVVPVLGYLAGF